MPAINIAGLLKAQDDACARCPTKFSTVAGALEEVVFIATMHFSLPNQPSVSNGKGKLVLVCPNCAREIERESR